MLNPLCTVAGVRLQKTTEANEVEIGEWDGYLVLAVGNDPSGQIALDVGDGTARQFLACVQQAIERAEAKGAAQA